MVLGDPGVRFGSSSVGLRWPMGGFQHYTENLQTPFVFLWFLKDFGCPNRGFGGTWWGLEDGLGGCAGLLSGHGRSCGVWVGLEWSGGGLEWVMGSWKRI